MSNEVVFLEGLRQKRNLAFTEYAVKAKSEHDSLDLCHKWSLFADDILKEAFKFYFAADEVSLFALGKLGSFELNLSSDVDLLFIAQESSPELISKVRRFSQGLSELTISGFVFRVDLDLRPGGKIAPLVPSCDEYINYYSSYGETWERIALLRMRPICGNPTIINATQEFNQKFIFRKHLDYRIFDDLKLLRSRIHFQVGIKKSNATDINLKLDPGGIRDIELFAQSWVVIHGGKNLNIRENATIEIYKLLSHFQLLPRETCEFLIKLYTDLRALENYVQGLNDQQTHLLTSDHLSSCPSWVKKLSDDLLKEMASCHNLVKDLLGYIETSAKFDIDEFVSQELLKDGWQEILNLKTHGISPEQQFFLKSSLIKKFIHEVQNSHGQQDLAISYLLDFLRSTRAKPSFFHLLLHNTGVLEQLAWMFGHSPYLAQIFISRPELLDSFVFRATSELSSDWEPLLEGLVEKKLLSEVINGVQFIKDRNLGRLVENCTHLADDVVKALIKKLNLDFESNVDLCCLGKWGSKELGLKSDLDFVMVVENNVEELHHKLARRFFSRLTEAHRGGYLYSIDLRLRPDGQAGLSILNLSDLLSFLRNESPVWVRQAYLRARFLSGKSTDAIKEALFARDLSADDLQELTRIQAELYKTARSPQDIKYAPGGLLDIELCAQSICLKNKVSLPEEPNSTVTFLKTQNAQELADIYSQLRCGEQLSLLLEQYNAEEIKKIDKLLHSSLHLLKSLDPRPRPF